jgi:DNA polymerase III subunit beta
MKASILQDKLAHGLSIVSKAVSPRSTLPVLANVLIATDEGRLRLSATNLELGITCWIGAKISEDGATTAPSRTISDLVSTLPKGSVEISLEEATQTLHVESGGSNTEIKCIDAQEFPPMVVSDTDEGIELDVKDFKTMIQQVVFAASNDDARPVLTGVLITIVKDTLTLTAADGFRVSVREAKLSKGIDGSLQAIVPARALSELSRIANDSDKSLKMILPKGRNQVVFKLPDIELTSQLIEGTFPDIGQVIPGNHTTRTIISTASFLKACKQAEIFAREGTHIARLNITPGSEMEPGLVEISAQSEQTGSSEATVEANIEGQSILIAFNVRYLREVLDVVDTPNVALETSASAAPGVIRPLGDEDFIHVIMPMHLGQ